jgi:glycosyltransferase involved in cell wall biosynthesis
MKVLMLAPGISPHSQRPLDWLLKNGCEVTFVDGTNPQPESSSVLYRYVNSPVLRGARYLNKLFGDRLGSLVQSKIAIPWLRNLINRVQPDIIHVHWVDFRAYACMKAGAKPLILTVWGSDINSCFLPDASQSHSSMIGEVLANADLIFVDAADMIDKCEQLAECKLPIELLPIGIDTNLFKPGYENEAKEWRGRLGISESAIVLSSVRAWLKNSSHDSILEAFNKALPNFKQEAILIFKTFQCQSSNTISDSKSQLIDRAEKLGISDSIRWIDGIEYDKLPELYSLSDAIINYPTMDAFPVTFLEAAACQCSVISCDLPSYTGTLAERYFQLLKPNDIQALADGMVSFVNQATLHNRKLPIEARNNVIEQFSEIVTQEKIIDSYNRFDN